MVAGWVYKGKQSGEVWRAASSYAHATTHAAAHPVRCTSQRPCFPKSTTHTKAGSQEIGQLQLRSTPYAPPQPSKLGAGAAYR
jgi:hypothetical protein